MFAKTDSLDEMPFCLSNHIWCLATSKKCWQNPLFHLPQKTQIFWAFLQVSLLVPFCVVLSTTLKRQKQKTTFSFRKPRFGHPGNSWKTLFLRPYTRSVILNISKKNYKTGEKTNKKNPEQDVGAKLGPDNDSKNTQILDQILTVQNICSARNCDMLKC